jgi:beta-glucanase (GH16 family)
MIYKSTALSLLLLLQLLKPTQAAQLFDDQSIASNCDCGYNDPTLNNNWDEMWHMNYDESTKSSNNTIGQQNLYTQKDLFFSNYVIPPKFGDNHARVFKKENVVLKEDSLEIGILLDPATKNIKCGGIGTTRQDILYGSFRSYIKTSKIPGTVAGMFIYHPQGEIDIEFLSSVKPSQAYFAMHPGLLDKKGGASLLTHGNYVFNYDPTIDYHEYRFDWFPNLTVFYVDGTETYRMTTNVLSQPSRFMFNHWTDGNKNFSQGPAKENAFIYIKNMTFFFNSSNALLSTPKCINVDSTCNIESKSLCVCLSLYLLLIACYLEILRSLKDKNTVFDSYLTNNKTSSTPSYTSISLPSMIIASTPTNSASSVNEQLKQSLIYLFITLFVAYLL